MMWCWPGRWRAGGGRRGHGLAGWCSCHDGPGRGRPASVSLLALHAEQRRKVLLAALTIAQVLVSLGLAPSAAQRLLTRLQAMPSAQGQQAERMLVERLL